VVVILGVSLFFLFVATTALFLWSVLNLASSLTSSADSSRASSGGRRAGGHKVDRIRLKIAILVTVKYPQE
jgi:hypothetical protein